MTSQNYTNGTAPCVNHKQMIEEFFESLASRKYNENDLSDVTLALCQSSPMFKVVFLKFFFPDMEISEDVVIERELSKDDSRVDFAIDNGGEKYIIENKINDQHQHFGDYDKTFGVKPEKFGYIANYVLYQPKDKHYQLRTWEGFYEHLEAVHADNDEEQSLIDGYRAYLKSVCNIIDFKKPMNIEGIYSLYELIETLTKLCKREEEHFTLSLVNQDRTYDNRYAEHSIVGVNFEITFKGCWLKSIGWVGIYFSEEIPTISIGFYDMPGWGQNVCSLIKNAKQKIDAGRTYDVPYEESEAYWFDYTDGKETYEEYFNKLTLAEQTEQLKLFMDEVFEMIYSLRKHSLS